MDRRFTYLVPDGLPVRPGCHVRVPFGAGDRLREGFALELTEDAPPEAEGKKLKQVHSLIDPVPVLLLDQLRLALWIRSAYNCLLVDALRLMIPSVLRGERAKVRTVRTVAAAPDAGEEAARAALLRPDGTPRAPKQWEVYRLLREAGCEMAVSDIARFIPGSGSAIRALLARGLLTESGHVTFRTPADGLPVEDRRVTLLPGQREAVEAVTASLGVHETFLLHGVTGSGKTEVYMHCIEQCLSRGRSAILLVPEISLTPQAVGLFRARFGGRIAVLHSRLSDGERFDEWRRIRSGDARVIIGARSAVFAPAQDVGLIIVDEEHEGSYQSEGSPRYHAVDVARKRGSLCGCPVLLGSATPQLISYYRAVNGTYRLLRLTERANRRPLPEVELADMRTEFLDGNNSIFSRTLQNALEECFAEGGQAMLFQNRRGYSTFVSCRACGTVLQCDNCDLSMTYHKRENRLVCHFCGESRPLPLRCPNCGKPFLKAFGVGTEQIEEQAKLLFPDIRVLRMDTDTIRAKNDLRDMLAAFARGDAQLLIGTQMIAKGHDFPGVSLVGVVAADSTLRFPDYRSGERTFQLLTQVAGRAGRAERPGRVIVQTYCPGHPVIRYAAAQDYEGFYRHELAERRKAVFPPYSLYARLLFTAQEETLPPIAAEKCRDELERELRALLLDVYEKTVLMLTASPSPIRRKNREFRAQVLVKLLRTEHTGRILRLLYAYADAHRGEESLPGLPGTFRQTGPEINPQDML